MTAGWQQQAKESPAELCSGGAFYSYHFQGEDYPSTSMMAVSLQRTQDPGADQLGSFNPRLGRLIGALQQLIGLAEVEH